MNLLEKTKLLLKQTHLKPDKLKGQNFCVNEGVLQEMVLAAELKKDEVVLEVGPGFGFLTEKLVQQCGKVVAVELEPVLAGLLKKSEWLSKNLEVIFGDILKLDISKIITGKYKVVANLPYSITSVFLKKMLTSQTKPESMTLLVQQEVAERICASPGEMSLLALSVQLYAKPKIIKKVDQACFWPKPKVVSAILKVEDIHDFPFAKQISAKDPLRRNVGAVGGPASGWQEKVFWQVLKAGFCAKRKTLENNLSNSFHLNKAKVKEIIEKAGLLSNVRSQELSLDKWLEVVTAIQNLIKR